MRWNTPHSTAIVIALTNSCTINHRRYLSTSATLYWGSQTPSGTPNQAQYTHFSFDDTPHLKAHSSISEGTRRVRLSELKYPLRYSCRYLSNSSATIYSLTGSLNKILVAVAGILIFQEISSLQNLASIGVGLLAALVFVFAKDLGNKK